MKKKKQNRYIYRVHFQTNEMLGWRRVVTNKKMTPARRERFGGILFEKLRLELEITKLVITDVEWINKIG
jgi:hypothetical protein